MANERDLKSKLDEVNGQIAEKRSEAQKEWKAFEQARDEFAAAGNDANRVDSDEFKKVDDVHKRYSTVAEDMKGLEDVRNGIFGMIGNTQPADVGQGPEQKKVSEGLGEKGLGDRSLESPEYKALLDSGALHSEHAKFNAQLGKSSRAELKTLITGLSDTSAGAFVRNDIKPYVPQPRRATRVLDLITTGATDSDTVEYARQTTFTNVAAETAEATTVDTGTKPEATIAFEKVTETVRTIAHWLPATRRALADAAQMRTLIDSQLRYGLEYRLESQVVNGAGTGETLKGILNQSGILTQAKGSDSVADAVHKAITQIRLGFIEPNGVALHPSDWEVIRLSRDASGADATTGGYLFGPPSVGGADTLWGLPVAVTPAVPDDTGIVADFRYYMLWLREGIQVLASDSHSDFFVKNLIAVLAEMRAAAGLTLAQAVCKVTSID